MLGLARDSSFFSRSRWFLAVDSVNAAFLGDGDGRELLSSG